MVEPTAAWIARDARAAPWETVQSPARPRAQRSDGREAEVAAFAATMLQHASALAGRTPRRAEPKPSPYALRARPAGPGGSTLDTGGPSRTRTPTTKRTAANANLGQTLNGQPQHPKAAPEPKPYNIAMPESSPVHATYTGVLASSLRLRELLDKQQQHHQHVSLGPPEAAPAADDAQSNGAAAARPRPHLRSSGCGVGGAHSQLAQLARALVEPAEGDPAWGTAEPGGCAAVASLAGREPTGGPGGLARPQSQQQQQGSYTVEVEEEGDVSMAELDACLAAGCASLEVPAAKEVAAASTRIAATAATGAAHAASVAAHSAQNAELGPERMAAAMVRASPAACRMRLRCESPLDLCRAVQSAQARASPTAGAGMSPVVAAACDATAVATALAAAEHSPAMRTSISMTPLHGAQGAVTPGSAQVRLQLPEPCLVKDMQVAALAAAPKGTTAAPASGSPFSAASAAAGRAAATAATAGTAAAAPVVASHLIRARSISRLNPAHPANAGRAASAGADLLDSAAASVAAASGSAAAATAAPEPAHVLTSAPEPLLGPVVPCTALSNSPALTPWAAAAARSQPSGSDDDRGHPRRRIQLNADGPEATEAAAGGAAAANQAGTATVNAAAAAIASALPSATPARAGPVAALAAQTAAALPDTPDTTGSLTIAQLAGLTTTTAATSTTPCAAAQPQRQRQAQRDGRRGREGQDVLERGVASLIAVVPPVGEATAAVQSGAAAVAAAAAEEAALAAVQLSTGEEDNCAPSPSGEERQQARSLLEQAAEAAAAQRRAGIGGRGGRRAAAAQAGRGRGRGRKPAAAAVAAPAATPPRAGMTQGEGQNSGEESSPDVPIGRLASTAALPDVPIGRLASTAASPDVPIGKLVAASPDVPIGRLASTAASRDVPIGKLTSQPLSRRPSPSLPPTLSLNTVPQRTAAVAASAAIAAQAAAAAAAVADTPAASPAPSPRADGPPLASSPDVPIGQLAADAMVALRSRKKRKHRSPPPSTSPSMEEAPRQVEQQPQRQGGQDTQQQQQQQSVPSARPPYPRRQQLPALTASARQQQPAARMPLASLPTATAAAAPPPVLSGASVVAVPPQPGPPAPRRQQLGGLWKRQRLIGPPPAGLMATQRGVRPRIPLAATGSSALGPAAGQAVQEEQQVGEALAQTQARQQEQAEHQQTEQQTAQEQVVQDMQEEQDEQEQPTQQVAVQERHDQERQDRHGGGDGDGGEAESMETELEPSSQPQQEQQRIAGAGRPITSLYALPAPAAPRVQLGSQWKRQRMAHAPPPALLLAAAAGRRGCPPVAPRRGPTTIASATLRQQQSLPAAQGPESAEPASSPDGVCSLQLQPRTAKGASAAKADSDCAPCPMDEDAPPPAARAPGGLISNAGHRTPPRPSHGRWLPGAGPPAVASPLHGVSVGTAGPGCGGGPLGRPPRSPGDVRMSPSPRCAAASPSPPSARSGQGGAVHRLRDPSLHPSAVGGTASAPPSGFGRPASVSPPQLLTSLLGAAVSAATASGIPRSGSTAVVASPPPLPLPLRSPLALLNATAAANPTSVDLVGGSDDGLGFLQQPLAPIRTRLDATSPGSRVRPSHQCAASTAVEGADEDVDADGVKPSIVKAVEALLSIPRVTADGDDDDSPRPTSTTGAGATVAAAAPTDPPPRERISSPGLDCLLEAAAVTAAVAGSSDDVAAAVRATSPLALLVDAAEAAVHPGHGAAAAAPAVGGRARTTAQPPADDGGDRDPSSDGPKPLRSALRGMQPFFSAPGPWTGAAVGAPDADAAGEPEGPPEAGAAGRTLPTSASWPAPRGSSGGVGSSLVCDERLEAGAAAGKAASPLPPRPRPSGKPPTPTDVRNMSPLGGRPAPRQPHGPNDSPLPSLRPLADGYGYSTPPFVNSRRGSGGGVGGSLGGAGAGGWARSGAAAPYPGHQYDSMIEDVVQQMLNEASPDSLPPLELGPASRAAGANTAAWPPPASTSATAGPAAMAGVTGAQGVQAAVDGASSVAVASAASAPGSDKEQQPGAVPPRRRSIYLQPASGKRRHSDEQEDPAAGGDAPASMAGDGSEPGAGVGAGSGAAESAAQHPGSEFGTSQQQEASPVVRRRPRKAARVDGGTAVATAAATAAVATAASNRMDLDELSNLGSEDSDSEEDERMLDAAVPSVASSLVAATAAGGRAAGGPATGAGGPAGAFRGNFRPTAAAGGGGGRGTGAPHGPGSMFTARANSHGPPGGGNWMRPGLAWSRSAGAVPMGPARTSPQLRPGGPPARPSPTGPPSAGGPAGLPLHDPAAAVDLLDVPRVLNTPRGTQPSKRASTYLSATAAAEAALLGGGRPTLEQEYREALINARLAAAWAAGERWARCDLAGLPADLSKRGVTERLAVLDSAASKLNCYRGAEGAAKIVSKVETEWEHLRRIRMGAAERATARNTPSATPPTAASGQGFAGGLPTTPLPFAAHAHAAAVGAASAAAHAAAAAAASSAVAVAAAASGPAPSQGGTAGGVTAASPATGAAASSQPAAAELLPKQQQQPQGQIAGPADYEAVAAAGHAKSPQRRVPGSGTTHPHCHRGSPPPPLDAPRPHLHPDGPSHAAHAHPAHQQHPLPSSAAAAATADNGTSLPSTNTDGAATAPSEGSGTPLPRAVTASRLSLGSIVPQTTPPPGEAAAAAGAGAEGGGGPTSALFLRHSQQQATPPPASILKAVAPTPVGAGAGMAGRAASATPAGGPCTTGGRKGVKFAAVLELGPQSGYRHKQEGQQQREQQQEAMPPFAFDAGTVTATAAQR